MVFTCLCCYHKKGFLKLPNLHMLIKQRAHQFPGTWLLALWWITNSFLNKCKSAILPLFNKPELLPSASNKAKLFSKNFSYNSSLDDSGISLPVFLSKTNLKLHNTSVTQKIIKKIVINLDLQKVSSPDCISVLVLKNCEPELLYILANSSICVWRILVFKIVRKSHWCSLYLRMLGQKGQPLKITALPIFFRCVVKSEKLAKIGLLTSLRNEDFVLISSMVKVLLNQRQILWQLYLIELLGLLTLKQQYHKMVKHT